VLGVESFTKTFVSVAIPVAIDQMGCCRFRGYRPKLDELARTVLGGHSRWSNDAELSCTAARFGRTRAASSVHSTLRAMRLLLIV
jgi:hypothetical protein